MLSYLQQPILTASNNMSLIVSGIIVVQLYMSLIINNSEMFSIIGYDLLTIIWWGKLFGKVQICVEVSNDLSSGNSPRHCDAGPSFIGQWESQLVLMGINQKLPVYLFFIFTHFGIMLILGRTLCWRSFVRVSELLTSIQISGCVSILIHLSGCLVHVTFSHT